MMRATERLRLRKPRTSIAPFGMRSYCGERRRSQQQQEKYYEMAQLAPAAIHGRKFLAGRNQVEVAGPMTRFLRLHYLTLALKGTRVQENKTKRSCLTIPLEEYLAPATIGY